MSARMIPVERLPHGDGFVWAYVLRCRCGAEGRATLVSGRHFGQALASKKLSAKGWRIGRSDADDICGDCAKRLKRDMKPKKPAAGKETAMAVTKEIARGAPPANGKANSWDEVLEQEPPKSPDRVMDVETRRIIMMRLNDVYLDAKSGYSGDWTDRKIADELNVPRAWVETIRDYGFGPAKSNEELRELLGEVEPIRRDMKATLGAMEKCRDAMVMLAAKAEAFERRIAKIEKAAG